MTDVAVIGLGQMGHEVARLLIEAGRSVTVWNRSREKGAALEARGADFARSVGTAIAASPVVFTVLLNAEVTQAVLRAGEVVSTLRGRTIVDLGTSGPDDARANQEWLRTHRAELIDAAIQAAPSQMGAADTPILLSGPESAFRAAQPFLDSLAGNLIYLGEDISGTAFMDLATLSYVYGSYAGFLHGARLAEQTGLGVGTYGKIVNTISPSFGAFFKHQGHVIQSGDFAVTQSPLRISIDAVERIERVSDGLELDSGLPRMFNAWLKEADASGFADEELAALIKVLRRRPGHVAKAAA